jgi:hypothetical protein
MDGDQSRFVELGVADLQVYARRRRVHSPLSPSRPARRVCAHSAIRLPRQSGPQGEVGSVPFIAWDSARLRLSPQSNWRREDRCSGSHPVPSLQGWPSGADRGHPASTPSVGTTRAATDFVMSDELCKTELCEGASIEACQDFYPRPVPRPKRTSQAPEFRRYMSRKLPSGRTRGGYRPTCRLLRSPFRGHRPIQSP